MKEHIEVDGLTVNYDEKPVVWQAEFSIPRGSMTAIIGPNGAGKSTLIKAMIGLHPAISGNVSFFGEPFENRQGKIAYVGQRALVDWDFPITVYEVVLMGMYGRLGLFKRPSKKDRERVLEVLDTIGMRPFANRQISDLSGGQQQRLFVARALLQEADILFLDEPFAGIDLTTEKLIVELLQDLAKKGKTIFVVHHDLSTVRDYFDHVILLNCKVVAFGKLADVYTKENLVKTFGGRGEILEEALLFARGKTQGRL